MIAVSVVLVAFVCSVAIAVLLAASAFLVVQLVGFLGRRLGGTLQSRWLTAIGALIAAAGLVALVWTQLQGPFGGIGNNASYRWQIAMGPLDVIGIGLLVTIAAQILKAVQVRQLVGNIEQGPLES